tara:strand:- start:1335 stop:1880 length:546 start_codon:yes stop_codon:yes gene_type:complete
MLEDIDNIFKYFSLFDLIYIIISLLTVIQCSRKGFVLSLLSFSKWILAIVITIVAVPKLRPWANNYIDSEYAVDLTLGISIFLVSIFIIMLASRGISKVVKYSGLGGLDSFFGFLFGFFKGYIISVLLFSLINWVYPYNEWPIKTERSFMFTYVYNGSNYLIKEFPNEKNYIDTKEKIKDI